MSGSYAVDEAKQGKLCYSRCVSHGASTNASKITVKSAPETVPNYTS